MTRHIVLGNGSLLVNIDKWLQVRDFYYPHVGEENHLAGHAHRAGIYTDGRISWLNEDEWKRKIAYREHTLVSDCFASNENLKIELKINDCVDCNKNIFLKKIAIKNLLDRNREIRLFFHHDFHLYGDGIGDTAGYEPLKNTVFHYKRKRHFLINAVNAKSSLKCGRGDLFDYSVGTADMHTINDANDGMLEKNPIAQGQVDSIISLKLDINAGSEESIYYWICCGQDFEEANKLNSFIMKRTPQTLMKETEICWLGLANKCKMDFADLSEDIIDEFKRSILIIRTQVDNHGAIIAANDSDNLQFNRDTYSYVWPRDGALAALALQKAGYSELAENFYIFCKETISDFGCFLHKYNPDGSLGSSWHPWIKGNKPQLPIQEDETALVIYALWDFYERTKNKEFAEKLYKPLIRRAADFMVNYIDEKTSLPKISYDLWEERQGIFTFTCSTVYAGLLCASEFAKLLKDNKKTRLYKETADKIKQAMLDYLFDNNAGRFLRMINFEGNEAISDLTIDSSLYAIFEFGILDANDSRVEETMKAVKEKLWVKSGVGGLARYENDLYHKASDDKSIAGNPWFVCTAWLGKYYTAKAKTRKELKEALEIINWIMRNALSTGVMPEQINPYTAEPLSVSPLTWSHSEFIDLVVNYAEKYAQLK
ncbi:glycoside hydrolase family 15 protein [Candidatus Woesearchaeota archaeon]|nr:glycoside hydrolase family 15 protein [Candidatus Woesearchaeota archaeon]